MRILAFSDIHNKTEPVQRLVAIVNAKDYDCVLVAGDIGSKAFSEIMGILDTLNLPVYYVLGNWDSKVDYHHSTADNGIHLHGNLIELNGYWLTGFSGCPSHWGNNPFAIHLTRELEHKHQHYLLEKNKKRHGTAHKNYLSDLKQTNKEILHRNKQALFERIYADKHCDPRRTIIITHEKLTRLGDYSPTAPLLHMYGHIHTFEHKVWQQTHFVNVSALDGEPSVMAKRKGNSTISPGNYCEIELNAGQVLCNKKLLPEIV
ncbi:metallophosphoesterase family protein [Salinimonas marina]|uniref:Metallophosphoesterase family protein n=1 Tax=Salinimonas marina TaxID=2785918 RepID=A0A7S9HCG7_9ALTE|nr:metallophosphoesterase family protein [Salinimonas marina]QPG05256.1 metallophosphoesterase family protein [Salinimonas marina]